MCVRSTGWGWWLGMATSSALGVTVFLTLAFSSNSAHAQITPDSTLPNNSSVTKAGNVFNITGGTQAGRNLFHSFKEFSVPTGGTAYFNNVVDIQNIISRVTGLSVSNIDGILRANGTANLFLINPNGIIFGPNAALNVGGSFVGTTANAIQFGNLGNFSASTPNAPSPLLTINPSALLFNQLSPASITNQSTSPAGLNPAGVEVTGLRVPDGRSLLLLGGNINIDGGSLRAYEGRIELAGLAAPGSVGLNVAGNTLNLSMPEGVPRADVFLTNGAEVNVRGANDGSIAINARNVNLAGASKLRAGIDSGLGTPNSKAGDILINATGSTTLSDNSLIANVVQPLAVGQGGNINIMTGSLSLSKSAALSTNTQGQGDGGSININAGSVSLTESAFLVADTNGQGDGGSININAGSVSLSEGALLVADTYGQGDGGSVFVQASGGVSVANSTIYNNVNAGAVGSSGGIFIKAGTLSLTDGTQLQSSIFGADAYNPGGRGNAGGVYINVSDRVTLAGMNQNGLPTGIFTGVGAGSVGKGGDININAGSVSITDGALLSTGTNGLGDGGNVNIKVRDAVVIAGEKNGFLSGISSSLETGAIGNGGKITIDAGSLSIRNGAQLEASTSGRGNGGNIQINARDTVTFDGVGSNGRFTAARTTLLSSAESGKSGDIQITTGSLFLSNGAFLTSSTLGKGDAGNITIDARAQVNFNGGSSAQSNVFDGGVGKGGDIRVTTGTLSLTNGAKLTNVSAGQGDAGNITIDARDTVNIDGIGIVGAISGVQTSLLGGVGKGGDIRLTTGSLFLKNGGQLNTYSSGIGNAGSISINARDTVAFDGFDSNGLQSGAQTFGINGNGGDIFVTTPTLSLTNGGALNTFALGNAGNITINARDTITLDGVVSSNGRPSGASSELLGGKGKGGDIFVTTGSLSLTNGARLASNTFGQGNGGNITIDARDAITLNGKGSNGFSSGVFSEVAPDGVGKGGDIRVTTGSLTVSNGAQLSVSSSGQGNGGNITLDARDTVRFDGVGNNQNSSGAYSTLNSGGVGNAGNINVTTGLLSLNNGAQISAGTFGLGKAGNITVNANTFEALKGGQVTTSTAGTGNAGTITLNLKENLTLAGSNPKFTQSSSGIFANTTVGSTGLGGSIFIDPRQATIRDGAKISVSSNGTGNAGNITLLAGTLTLDNQGSISAQTASSSGGNINLQLGKALFLRRGSQISTTAGTAQAGGDGGNITINAPFIVAVPNENSHIAANAFSGNGGRVDIATKGIYGINFQSIQTLESDITASSQLGVQGEVTISQPDVQPTQGLIQLPSQFQDVSNQIGQVCPKGIAAIRRLSEFIITGRGSLPPSPLEPLAISSNLIPLATLESDSTVPLSNKHTSTKLDNFSTPLIPTKIVEATGWVKYADGSIELVAQVPEAFPHDQIARIPVSLRNRDSNFRCSE